MIVMQSLNAATAYYNGNDDDITIANFCLIKDTFLKS